MISSTQLPLGGRSGPTAGSQRAPISWRLMSVVQGPNLRRCGGCRVVHAASALSPAPTHFRPRCLQKPTFPPLSHSSTQVRRRVWIPSFLGFAFREQTLQGGLPQLPGPGHPGDPTKREITGASPSSDWLFPLVQCSPGPSLLSPRVSLPSFSWLRSIPLCVNAPQLKERWLQQPGDQSLSSLSL